MSTQQVTFEFRRGTAAQWVAANPTLSSGEPGYETDTGNLKIGNGSTSWTGLGYINGGGVIGTPSQLAIYGGNGGPTGSTNLTYSNSTGLNINNGLSVNGGTAVFNNGLNVSNGLNVNTQPLTLSTNNVIQLSQSGVGTPGVNVSSSAYNGSFTFGPTGPAIYRNGAKALEVNQNNTVVVNNGMNVAGGMYLQGASHFTDRLTLDSGLAASGPTATFGVGGLISSGHSRFTNGLAVDNAQLQANAGMTVSNAPLSLASNNSIQLTQSGVGTPGVNVNASTYNGSFTFDQTGPSIYKNGSKTFGISNDTTFDTFSQLRPYGNINLSQGSWLLPGVQNIKGNTIDMNQALWPLKSQSFNFCDFTSSFAGQTGPLAGGGTVFGNLTGIFNLLLDDSRPHHVNVCISGLGYTSSTSFIQANFAGRVSYIADVYVMGSGVTGSQAVYEVNTLRATSIGPGAAAPTSANSFYLNPNGGNWYFMCNIPAGYFIDQSSITMSMTMIV